MIFRDDKNDPWSNHPKTQFGPIYLFFWNHEPWPVLRTWKVHFDWTWILGLKSFLPWEIFHNQQGCCLFSLANKNPDQSFTCSGWILNCQVHNRIVKKKWWKNEMERKNDFRLKIREGNLEQKRENFWSLMGEANRRMKGQRPDNIWIFYEVFYPLQNQKFELFVPECLPSNSRVYHGGS